MSGQAPQVLFSSNIMYSNYLSINQRMQITHHEEQNQARVALVRSLSCHSA